MATSASKNRLYFPENHKREKRNHKETILRNEVHFGIICAKCKQSWFDPGKMKREQRVTFNDGRVLLDFWPGCAGYMRLLDVVFSLFLCLTEVNRQLYTARSPNTSTV